MPTCHPELGFREVMDNRVYVYVKKKALVYIGDQ